MKKVLGPPSEDRARSVGPSEPETGAASTGPGFSNAPQGAASVPEARPDPPRPNRSQFHPIFTDISQVLVPSVTVGAGAGESL
jgi:hypothetical protein